MRTLKTYQHFVVIVHTHNARNHLPSSYNVGRQPDQNFLPRQAKKEQNLDKNLTMARTQKRLISDNYYLCDAVRDSTHDWRLE